MTLRTRKPSGAVAFPLVLLEGQEQSGKSYQALKLSSSPRVGRTFVLEIGEPTADEYAPLGPYEILEHNGTYLDMLAQLEAATAEPSTDGKPNVIVIDSITMLWEGLKDWTDARARNSRAGREKLAKDPDAEVDPSMNLWNDAKDRWYRVLNLLRGWPGLGVLVARAKEVAKVVNGAPVAGQTDYSIQAEKTTGFAVTAQVRMTRPHTARLVACRSLHVDVPRDGIALPDANPLEHLVFELLGAGGAFGARNLVQPAVGIPAPRAKTMLLERLTEAGLGAEEAKKEAAGLWHLAGLGAEVTDAEWAKLLADAEERLVARSGPPAEEGTTEISAEVAAMSIDEVANLLSALGRAEPGSPEELRRRLTELNAEQAAKAPGEVEETSEEFLAVVHDVDSMAPKDVTAHLRERDLDISGSADDRRKRLVGARWSERADAGQGTLA